MSRLDDAEPGDGTPVRNKFAANPSAMLDPHAACGHGHTAMTSGRRASSMGTGDARPPVLRPGSQDAAALPSRTGWNLRLPNGTTTPATPLAGKQP